MESRTNKNAGPKTLLAHAIAVVDKRRAKGRGLGRGKRGRGERERGGGGACVAPSNMVCNRLLRMVNVLRRVTHGRSRNNRLRQGGLRSMPMHCSLEVATRGQGRTLRSPLASRGETCFQLYSTSPIWLCPALGGPVTGPPY